MRTSCSEWGWPPPCLRLSPPHSEDFEQELSILDILQPNVARRAASTLNIRCISTTLSTDICGDFNVPRTAQMSQLSGPRVHRIPDIPTSLSCTALARRRAKTASVIPARWHAKNNKKVNSLLHTDFVRWKCKHAGETHEEDAIQKASERLLNRPCG